MVRLDATRRARRVVTSAFDHVRIQRALCEEINVTELAGLLRKDADELVADDAPLRLRVSHPVQASNKGICRVDVEQPHAQGLLERVHHAPRLAPANKPMVAKDTVERVPAGRVN